MVTSLPPGTRRPNWFFITWRAAATRISTAVILWRSQAHIPSPLLLAWVTQWTMFLGLAEGFRASLVRARD